MSGWNTQRVQHRAPHSCADGKRSTRTRFAGWDPGACHVAAHMHTHMHTHAHKCSSCIFHSFTWHKTKFLRLGERFWNRVWLYAVLADLAVHCPLAHQHTLPTFSHSHAQPNAKQNCKKIRHVRISTIHIVHTPMSPHGKDDPERAGA